MRWRAEVRRDAAGMLQAAVRRRPERMRALEHASASVTLQRIARTAVGCGRMGRLRWAAVVAQSITRRAVAPCSRSLVLTVGACRKARDLRGGWRERHEGVGDRLRGLVGQTAMGGGGLEELMGVVEDAWKGLVELERKQVLSPASSLFLFPKSDAHVEALPVVAQDPGDVLPWIVAEITELTSCRVLWRKQQNLLLEVHGKVGEAVRAGGDGWKVLTSERNQAR